MACTAGNSGVTTISATTNTTTTTITTILLLLQLLLLILILLLLILLLLQGLQGPVERHHVHTCVMKVFKLAKFRIKVKQMTTRANIHVCEADRGTTKHDKS